MNTPHYPHPEVDFLRRLSSPIGRIELTSDGKHLTGLAIESAGQLPHDQQNERSCAILDAAANQLTEYFSGTRRSFDLPLSAAGTDFQQSVWSELSQLPYGAAVSYADIGRATGRPTAGRAVGGAVGANPIPIIVPCHRVLASNQRITGYSGGDGVPTKVWLLKHEGISHK
ncbi:methylated-DNA--[protein]-cysteine S-methyltransferase [Rhodoglobus sp. NPDC076762]